MILEETTKDVIREKCEESLEFFTRYFFVAVNNRKYRMDNTNTRMMYALKGIHEGGKTEKTLCFHGVTHRISYKTNDNRLVIHTDERSGGSECLMYYIAWCLMKNPRANFIFITYSLTLANVKAMFIKEIIDSEEFKELWPEIQVDYWEGSDFILNGGGVYPTSSQHNIIGFGAGNGGAIIYDDPMKKINMTCGTEVGRFKYVNQVIDAFKLTKNRVDNVSVPIIIHSKRYEGVDLANYALFEEDEDEYIYLNLTTKEKQ